MRGFQTVGAVIAAVLLVAGAAACGGSGSRKASPGPSQFSLSPLPTMQVSGKSTARRSSSPKKTSPNRPGRSSSPVTRTTAPRTGARPPGRAPAPAQPPAPLPPSGATLHYAANDNFDSNGKYILGSLGFNLADVSSRSLLDLLPAGVRGLVYLGSCAPGTDAAFRAGVDKYAGASKLWGFYLADEPEPSSCPVANLRSEAAYIRSKFPNAVTFVLIQNTDSSKAPTFKDGYTPTNLGVDLIGLDPYPCRTELNGCDYAMIGRYVAAANRAGIPTSRIVPVFQAFGGGDYPDDGGGKWALPSADQAQRLLAEWATYVPHPAFDFVYSWGTQRGDTALSTAPASLRQVFAAHNG